MSLIYTENEWTIDRLHAAEAAIYQIAIEELNLDLYPNRIEIISSSQMLDAYASHGMPLMYNHWSFGKHFIQHEYQYRKGYSGLAYEIVIATDPAISHLMAENSMTMQTLVIAHAAMGHNNFFKTNYLFNQWGKADSILDYLKFAKNYVRHCEEKYGPEIVESTIDAAHAIMLHGVDRYKRASPPNKATKKQRIEDRAVQQESQKHILWDNLPNMEVKNAINQVETRQIPDEPEENLLYFLEKYSPVLKDWQREILRIVRQIQQMFWASMQTKTMNEGWASYVHYYIMNRLWEKGQISNANYLEFIHSHTNVLTQLPYNHKHYNGFNPYALGFAIYDEIKRVCTEPTSEDCEYFPHLIGKDWLTVCKSAVANYRDESFIAEFLTPNLVRKWQMFEITNNETDSFVTVTNIQNSSGFDAIRRSISNQYSMSNLIPDIQIINANLDSDRELVLEYKAKHNMRLTDQKHKVIDYIAQLWGHKVRVIGA